MKILKKSMYTNTYIYIHKTSSKKKADESYIYCNLIVLYLW